MNKKINEIYGVYETNNINQPRVTDSFAEAQVNKSAARENSSYRDASPSAIAKALRIVYKNEGARFINHSSETLTMLVSRVLEDESIRCA